MVQKIKSIVGALGFFSYVTCPHFCVQYLAAGEPDCVVGYSGSFCGSGVDDGNSVQLQSARSIGIANKDNRIMIKKGNKSCTMNIWEYNPKNNNVKKHANTRWKLRKYFI